MKHEHRQVVRAERDRARRAELRREHGAGWYRHCEKTDRHVAKTLATVNRDGHPFGAGWSVSANRLAALSN